jgi:hypothetical protein
VVERDPAIRRLVSLQTMHVGPEAVLVAIHAEFRAELTTRQIEGAIDRMQEAIRTALDGHTGHRLILIEPARGDEARGLDTAA